MGLRCFHTSIFIKTPSLEGLPTKAKEDPSPHDMRLSPTGHQPSISWSRGKIIIIIIIIMIIIIIIIINTISLYEIPHLIGKNLLKAKTYFKNTFLSVDIGLLLAKFTEKTLFLNLEIIT